MGQQTQINQNVMPAIVLHGQPVANQELVLTQGVMTLLTYLCTEFANDVPTLLQRRIEKRSRDEQGEGLDFLSETRALRAADWQVDAVPECLQMRKVELRTKTTREALIEAMKADINILVADFFVESQAGWSEVIAGHHNLCDAVRGELNSEQTSMDEVCQLSANPRVLTCRVRGLDKTQDELTFDGQKIPAALFDFAVYFYHNYRHLLLQGSGPYFEIPDVSDHLEARWWARVFAFVEDRFCLTPGSIKCTCSIVNYSAAFEMEEISHELKANLVALRSDTQAFAKSYYQSFSYQQILQLTAEQEANISHSVLDAYSRLLVKTSHRRGALAIATAIAETTHQAMTNNVKMARDGHDGISVVDQGIALQAMQVFDNYIGQDNLNQRHIIRDVDAPILAADLIK